MKQVTGYRLQLILLGLILFFSTTYHLQPTTSYAQEASPSGSLLQKLNELKSEIASKAAQLKTQVSQKVQNKAIIGPILLIETGQLTIHTLNGDKTIKFDEFTTVIGAKNKEIKIDTLEENDSIAALGDMDDKNILVAQKLIYLENPASISAQLIRGQIQKSAGNSITVTDKEGQTQNIVTNAQTQFFLGNNEASLADAKVEQFLLARVTPQRDGSLRARFIYFIPSAGFNKPIEKPNTDLKSSSPSASPKR